MFFALLPPDVLREIFNRLQPVHILFTLRIASKTMKRLVEQHFCPQQWIEVNTFFVSSCSMSMTMFQEIFHLNHTIFHLQLSSSYLPLIVGCHLHECKKKFGQKRIPGDILQNKTVLLIFGKQFSLTSGTTMIQAYPYRIRSVVFIDFIDLQTEQIKRHVFSQFANPLWINELISTDSLFVLLLDQKFIVWWTKESLHEESEPTIDMDNNYMDSNGQVMKLELFAFYPWITWDVTIRSAFYNIWMATFRTNHRDSTLSFKPAVHHYWFRFYKNKLEYSSIKKH